MAKYLHELTQSGATSSLMPAYGFERSTVFGTSYEQPLFLNLSNSADLTIDTKFTQKEGVLLKKDYRKKFN